LQESKKNKPKFDDSLTIEDRINTKSIIPLGEVQIRKISIIPGKIFVTRMEDTEMEESSSRWRTVLSQTQRKAEKQKEKEPDEKEKDQTEKDATNNEEQTPTNIPGIIDTTSKLLEKYLKITI